MKLWNYWSMGKLQPKWISFYMQQNEKLYAYIHNSTATLCGAEEDYWWIGNFTMIILLFATSWFMIPLNRKFYQYMVIIHLLVATFLWTSKISLSQFFSEGFIFSRYVMSICVLYNDLLAFVRKQKSGCSRLVGFKIWVYFWRFSRGWFNS